MKKQTIIIGEVDQDLSPIFNKLCEEGYDVRTPQNGKAAILCLGNSYDFMIISHQMPDMNCITVLEEAVRKAPGTQVIVLKSHPSIETAIDAIKQDDTTITIDLKSRVIKQNRIQIRLTPTESRLLNVLLENQGKLVDHKRLVQLTHGYEIKDSEAPFMLRPLVSRLRHKLEEIPGLHLKIINIRGTGYMVEINS